MTPGIFRLTMADYLADPCPVPSLSGGCAFRLITESPMHAWHSHPRLGGRVRDDSNASDMGTVAHDLLLGGEGKICEIRPEDHRSKDGAVPTGWTNSAIRAARNMARLNGLTPILSGEIAAVRRMVGAARDFVASSSIAGVFDHGASELTVIARDGETWLRTRPDWLNLEAGISLSYKTTVGKVSEKRFGPIAESSGYWFSAMFYERALQLVLDLQEDERAEFEEITGCSFVETKAGRLRHVILAQEQHAPYACALFELSPAKAAIEREQVRRAIALWQRCLASNSWPGYSPQVVRVEPKPWELAAEEERLQAEELETMEA